MFNKSAKTSVIAIGKDFDVLASLCDRRASFSIIDVAVLLKCDAEDAETRIAGWERLGLLEKAPFVDGEWEVTHVVTELLLHFTGRQKALLAGGLAGLITDIGACTERLKDSVSKRDPDRIELAANEIKDCLIRASHIARTNAEGIENAILSIKRLEKAQTIADQYQSIVHIQTNYLAPMMNLIQAGGEMERVTDALHAEIAAAKSRYDPEHGIGLSLSSLEARLSRFRLEATESFTQAFKAFAPLFNRIRDDHAIASAVSTAIEVFRRQGFRPWGLEERLLYAGSKDSRPLATESLRAYFVGILQARKTDAAPNRRLRTSARSASEPAPAFLTLHHVQKALAEQAPVADVLAWLPTAFPWASEPDLLRVYFQWLLSQPETQPTGVVQTLAWPSTTLRHTPLQGSP